MAFDEASNYTNEGQITTLNGGFGFASAFINADSSTGGDGGQFLVDAGQNANGSGGGINSSNGRSFLLYSVSNNGHTLSRSFTAPIQAGGTFSLGFDNGYVDGGRRDQIFLGNAANPNLVEFGFQGSSSYLFDNVASPLSYTPDGLNVQFNLLDATNYTLTATRLNGGSYTATGTLAPGMVLDRFSVNASANSNGGQPFDLFVNKFQVTAPNAASAAPEPSQYAALGFTALGMLGLVLRAKKRTASIAA